mgnify:FL=1
MDPLGRCLTICIIFTVFCAFFSFSASVLSAIRIPDESEEEDEEPLSLKLYRKRNACRYRLACSAVFCALAASVCVSYAFAEKLERALPDTVSFLALPIVICVSALVILCFGVYIPAAVAGNAASFVPAQKAADAACKFSLIFAGIPALISRLILKLFSVEPDAARTDVTEKEILKLVDEGETSGALNSEEREMIENIFDFSEHSVREIMTHYMDVTAICEGTPDDEILKTISDTGYSRYPVYKNDIGSVTGILIAKEYLTDRLSGSPRPFTELVRAPLFVPESMQTDSVLREMKQKGQHMAIVVNEYGEACGVVTMEDLLEEIVGDIYDESDTPDDRDPEISRTGDSTWLVHASCPLDEFEEETGISLEDKEGIDTIGSLVFSRLTKIPDDGVPIDVETEHLLLHSDGLHERRLEWVSATEKKKEEAEDE